MWDYFFVDGDGEWIHEGLIAGSLAIVHDGSYMRELDQHASSVGFVFLCLHTGNVCKVALAERSTSASN